MPYFEHFNETQVRQTYTELSQVDLEAIKNRRKILTKWGFKIRDTGSFYDVNLNSSTERIFYYVSSFLAYWNKVLEGLGSEIKPINFDELRQVSNCAIKSKNLEAIHKLMAFATIEEIQEIAFEIVNSKGELWWECKREMRCPVYEGIVRYAFWLDGRYILFAHTFLAAGDYLGFDHHMKIVEYYENKLVKNFSTFTEEML